MKIARIKKSMTIRQLEKLLRGLPWCDAKMIDGQVHLIRRSHDTPK